MSKNMINQSLPLTCLFGVFVFLQFTVLGLANHAGEGYLTTAQRDFVYYGLQIFVILGFVLYSLFFRFCTGKRRQNAIAYGIPGLFLLCGILLFVTGHDSLFYVIVAMTAALCIGVVGGAAHLRMSMASVSGMDVARFMGLGSAAAVILQYLLQIRWGVTPVLPFFMLAAFILFLFLLRRTAPQVVTEGEGKVEPVPSRRIFFSVLIASTFILFACYYNESIHHLMIRSDYASANVYSWPRLMMVPVYLLYAVTGDRKKGKLVPVVSLCIMLIALLNVVLIGNAGSYWLNMCFFYVVIATYTVYYLLTFWRLAPGTRHPALWAPFGRMLDSGMVLLTGAVNLSAFSAFVVLGADIVGAVVVILLMAINGDLDLAKSQTVPELVPAGPERLPSKSEITPAEPKMPPSKSEITPAEPKMPPSASETTQTEPEKPPSAPLIASPAPKIAQTALSPEEALKRMRERYDLTRRETEVLRELVCTEDKQTAISERLEIQVRTLQDYVTRLYRKTGTATRAGLTDLYHKTMNE